MSFDARWEKFCKATPELRNPETLITNIKVAVIHKIAKTFWDAALLNKKEREELAKKFGKTGKKDETFEDLMNMFGSGPFGDPNPFSK